MTLGSRLKVESKGILATSIFYAAVGISFIVLLPLGGFQPHIGILGILSLAAAYGVFRMRGWSLWFVIVLFFSGTTFASYMIYGYVTRDLLIGMSMIAYLVLTWIFTAYVAAKRSNLG
jgi:hypothetical protein